MALITTDSRDHFKEYDSRQPYFGTAPQALLQGFENVPDLEVHVLSCIHEAMESPAKLGDNIWYHGLHVSRLGWLKTGYQGCIRAIRKKLKEIQPDLVHGQGTERDCAIGAVFSGYPNVITIHGNMRLVAKLTNARPLDFNWLAARFESFTLPKSDGVICITNYTRDAVKDLAARTWLLPNAVDASFFDIRSQPASPANLLCVGAIGQRKNQNLLIRSLDELAERHPFRMIFLGQNPGGDYGKEFLDLIGKRSWCHYEGFAGRDELKGQLAQASGLVLPSLEDNCPMVVLEAMAAGVPVAAANVGGVPDLVENGVTGFLMDPLDSSSIRAAVESLLKTPGSLRPMIERARQQALERYHPGVVAAAHLNIYREILESRKAPGKRPEKIS